MKNGIRIFGIIIFAIVIGFTFITCDPEGDKPETTTQGNEITITIAGSNVQLTMNTIPSGSFQRSGHTITLSGFQMSKYQVTQGQYEAVMETNPSWFTTAKGRPPATGETDAKRPVESVSWYDAIEFCNALSVKQGLTPYYIIDKDNEDPNNTNSWDTLKWTITVNTSANGYRLPTEAQWEYACRAGTDSGWNWYFGNTESELVNHAWYSGNSNSMTHEVGKKKANPWGLHDVHGNVWEWCWDWLGSYPDSVQTNPQGAVSGAYRVLRGGCWFNSASNTRSADRDYIDPYFRFNDIGFRLVRP
ncbi:MAG: formylglycine-generating enzyme family protein [Treponema sp.]|nr:formylglycine-generating enzyme family protein [Treponema sp.]